MKISPVVAVQMPWDIARCMLMVVHHNTGICMSGMVSCLCTVHGCTIASGMLAARVIVSAMCVAVLAPGECTGSGEGE